MTEYRNKRLETIAEFLEKNKGEKCSNHKIARQCKLSGPGIVKNDLITVEKTNKIFRKLHHRIKKRGGKPVDYWWFE